MFAPVHPSPTSHSSSHAAPHLAPRAYPVRVAMTLPLVVRAGLESLLTPHLDRVEPLADADRSRAHVELFDPEGPEAGADPGVPRVAITWDTRDAIRSRARALGAVRVLPLSIGVGDLVRTVEQVHATLGAEAGAELHEAGHDGLLDDDPGGARLSPRERDVVRGICAGLSNAEIAERLYLSVNSVKTYIRTAYRKMGVSSRSQAVLWGLTNGL